MRKLLIILPVGFVAWYVYSHYLKHNTALPGAFPTIGMGGTNTAGVVPTQA